MAIIQGLGGEGIAIPRRINRGNRSSKININRNIRAKEVRVIDPDGNQMGVIPTYKAIAVANDFGLDLVEVSPNVSPPVCKIMDYGRYKYEQTKKKQEAKKKQAAFQLKEIKLRPKTDEHDLKTKINHIKKFIERKDKVKVTVEDVRLRFLSWVGICSKGLFKKLKKFHRLNSSPNLKVAQ